MTTLRIEPNKYPNESDIWYKTTVYSFQDNEKNNSLRMCTYLNHIFQSELKGLIFGSIEIVRYPLPRNKQLTLEETPLGINYK